MPSSRILATTFARGWAVPWGHSAALDTCDACGVNAKVGVLVRTGMLCIGVLVGMRSWPPCGRASQHPVELGSFSGLQRPQCLHVCPGQGQRQALHAGLRMWVRASRVMRSSNSGCAVVQKARPRHALTTYRMLGTTMQHEYDISTEAPQSDEHTALSVPLASWAS